MQNNGVHVRDVMIGILLYFILAAICTIGYIKKKYVIFLLTYLGLLTHCMSLDNFTGCEFGKDFAIIVNYLCLGYTLLSNKLKNKDTTKKGILAIRKDDTGYAKYCILILAFLSYYAFEFIRTVIFSYETIPYAYKVVRIPQILLAFFLLRKIPIQSFIVFMRIFYYLNLILCVLFLLQFTGLISLYGSTGGNENDINYHINLPFGIFYCLFYAIRYSSIRFRIPTILLSTLCILLTFVRSSILITFLFAFIIMLKNRKRTSMKYTLLGMVILIPFMLMIVKQKSSDSGATIFEDVRNLTSRQIDYSSFSSGSGTLTFRIFMLAERIDYLLENKQYLPFGVGAIHEDSEACATRFSFFIGTANKEKLSGNCQIDSGDITWVPIVLRYGIVGLLLHVFFMIFIFIQTAKQNNWIRLMALIFATYIISSFSTTYFENELRYFEYAFVLILIFKSNSLHKESLI